MNSQDLLAFQDLVRRRSGLQLETMAESSLMLAVQKRMAATQADLPSAYYTRVLGDEAEFDELVSLLTINETYFYREPKQLALLTEQILPSLLAKGAALPLRIFSAGCSTGEEPYSIAMAILEKFGESANRMVSIAAGDIDQHALRRARHAHYPEYSFRATPPVVRERYFTPLPGGRYRLHEPVRAMVEFHALNLLASPLPEKLADFDVIFFRNVSIYFDAATRERIQRTLHAAMRETGYLVLGTAETLANDLGVFQLREVSGSFYFAKGLATSTSPPAPGPVARPVSRPRLGVPPAKTVSVSTRAIPVTSLPAFAEAALAPVVPAIAAEQVEAVRGQLRARQYGEALTRLAGLRQVAPEDIDLQLLESYALLQSRRFAEAARLARQVLERDNWSVDAMMVLGFIAKWEADNITAIGHFKTAVYTRPDCWPAHYYLGGLLLESEAVKARREYRTALRQLTANPDPDGGLRLPLGLPVADIRFLCERRSAMSEESS